MNYGEIELGKNTVTIVPQQNTFEQLESEVFEDAKDQQDMDNKEELQESFDPERNRQRRHSKSVDEFELAHLRKQKQPQQKNTAGESSRVNKPQQMSLDIVDQEIISKQPARQASMPNAGCNIRRKSKDDSEVTKVDASVLRKRFARLLDTLRSHKFSISSLEENSNSNLNTKSESND